MSFVFHESMNTGDIVTKFPAASKLFKQYKIDFCCGGNRPIGEVLLEKELTKNDILGQINEMYKKYTQTNDTDWMNSPLTKLVQYITEKYHQYTREVLEELSVYVAKVYRVHGERDAHLKEVYDFFFLLRDELEQHLLDEEQIIFPHIIEYDQSASQEARTKAKKEIAHLEKDHDAAGDLLKKIRQATNDYQLPPNACNTYTLTYLKLEELESETFDHIHLENNILFKRI
ncbi:iron-sulfur cluster repair di-iron protein [Niallia sp. 03133]|uniref:iron-sulfur cluster repair di-iron protein n=1 Tax=Niallia sp. 03133 TaxID=3458060 RepID=UPI004043B207